jgi:hypothetical protein
LNSGIDWSEGLPYFCGSKLRNGTERRADMVRVSDIPSQHWISARKQCAAIIDQSISARANFFDNSNKSGTMATVCNFTVA